MNRIYWRGLGLLAVAIFLAGCQSAPNPSFAPLEARLDLGKNGAAPFFVIRNRNSTALHNYSLTVYLWNDQEQNMLRRSHPVKQGSDSGSALPPGKELHWSNQGLDVEAGIMGSVTRVEVVGHCDEGDFRQTWRNEGDKLVETSGRFSSEPPRAVASPGDPLSGWSQAENRAHAAIRRHQFNEATNALGSALEFARASGPSNAMEYVTLMDTAQLYLEVQRAQPAIKALQEALASAEAAFGPKHPEAGYCAALLAEFVSHNTEFATKLIGRARESLGGSTGPADSMGVQLDIEEAVVKRWGSLDAQAEAALLDALKRVESPGYKAGAATRCFGEGNDQASSPAAAVAKGMPWKKSVIDNLDKPRILLFLGEVYLSEIKSDDAKKAFESARDLSAPGSKERTAALQGLIKVFQVKADPKAALPLCQELLQDAEKQHGHDNLAVAPLVRELARCEESLPDAAAAESCYQRIVALNEKADPNAMATATSREELGDFYLRQKNYDAAERVFRPLLPAGDTVAAINILKSLARVYEAAGKDTELEATYKRQIQVIEHLFGADNRAVEPHLLAYAKLLQRQSRTAEAQALEARIAALRDKAKR